MSEIEYKLDSAMQALSKCIKAGRMPATKDYSAKWSAMAKTSAIKRRMLGGKK